MNLIKMSRLVIILSFVFFLFTAVLAGDDEFNIERLPIGNSATKYSFCAVKLNRIFDTNANKHIDYTELSNLLSHKRIVMVGESHTNNEHHLVQLKVIQGLVEAGKKVCLALEMFKDEHKEVLADFVAGKFPKEEFVDRVDWFKTWGYNYRMYQPIFEYARDHQVKIFGVNIKRKYVSKISREGIKGLSEEDLAALPKMDTTNVEHQFLVKAYFTGSDALQPELFWNKYLAQSVWDAAMAEGAVKIARENPAAVVVILAGSGHIAYNLGIGKVIQNQGDFPFASLIAVDVPKEKEESLMEIMQKHRKRKKDDSKKKTAEMDQPAAGEALPDAMKKAMPAPEKKKPAAMAKKMPSSMKKMPAGMKPGKSSTDKKMPGALKKMSPAMEKMMAVMADTIPHKIVIRSLADFLWGVPDTEGKSAYPSLGFRLGKKVDQGIEINIIFPESLAEENELQNDDIIVKVDDIAFKTKNDLKKYLHTKNWNDSIKFELLRDEVAVIKEFVLKWEEEEEKDD